MIPLESHLSHHGEEGVLLVLIKLRCRSLTKNKACSLDVKNKKVLKIMA